MSDFSKPSDSANLAGVIVVMQEKCRQVYGRQYEEKRSEIRTTLLEPHHKKYKTNNLLASAIGIIDKEKREATLSNKQYDPLRMALLLSSSC